MSEQYSAFLDGEEQRILDTVHETIIAYQVTVCELLNAIEDIGVTKDQGLSPIVKVEEVKLALSALADARVDFSHFPVDYRAAVKAGRAYVVCDDQMSDEQASEAVPLERYNE